jgi:hypothetical protein
MSATSPIKEATPMSLSPPKGSPHLEKKASIASADREDAIAHFMQGRSQHESHAPRHFSFRPDSAGTKHRSGQMQHGLAPILAKNAELKDRVAELEKQNASLAKENGKLKLKVIELERAMTESTEPLGEV